MGRPYRRACEFILKVEYYFDFFIYMQVTDWVEFYDFRTDSPIASWQLPIDLFALALPPANHTSENLK